MKHLIYIRAGLLGLLLLSVFAASAWSDPPMAKNAVANTTRCQSLQESDFSAIPDAPTQVISAAFVAAADDKIAYCDVQGYITRDVGFSLRMPAAQWNGKLVQIGCGGFCGVLYTEACYAPMKKGYACVTSNLGHTGTVLDGKWAYNNLEGEIDYAYRATHVSTVAAKVIVDQYYGKIPGHSYMMGCSRGAHQGMVAAQYFPYDFDGIVAGAPALNFSGNFMNLLWGVRAAHGQNNEPLLKPDDLERLHKAVIAQCDLNDGARDGLIGDPRQCHFEPSTLACVAGKTAGCLTPIQVTAAQKIYAGPVTSQGEQPYLGGTMPGSELNWTAAYINSSFVPRITTDFFRYTAFLPDPGPSWKLSDFDFDRDYQRFGMMEFIHSASNPDLRQFKKVGGKLLAYWGWADANNGVRNYLDYFDTVERVAGGTEAMQDFYRLFMVPGMDHCTGGEGAYAIDYLSYLEAWVEQGKAPDVMIGAHPKDYKNGNKVLPFQITFPLDPKDIEFTRPVYPHPLQAKYKGSGDPKEASSFMPTDPQR